MNCNSSMRFSGGCQCGAIRFVCEQILRPSICYCRMCQKAFAAPYGAYVVVDQFEITRGSPKFFRSSNKIKRGFCGDCGTQMFVSSNGKIENVESVAIFAFDDPNEFEPQIKFNSEKRVYWCDELVEVPAPRKGKAAIAKYQNEVISFQHPDHDTDHWPPEGAR